MSKMWMVATVRPTISVSCLAIKPTCVLQSNIPVSRRTRARVMIQRVIPRKVATRATRVAESGVLVQVWGMALPTRHLGLLP